MTIAMSFKNGRFIVLRFVWLLFPLIFIYLKFAISSQIFSSRIMTYLKLSLFCYYYLVSPPKFSQLHQKYYLVLLFTYSHLRLIPIYLRYHKKLIFKLGIHLLTLF